MRVIWYSAMVLWVKVRTYNLNTRYTISDWSVGFYPTLEYWPRSGSIVIQGGSCANLRGILLMLFKRKDKILNVKLERNSGTFISIFFFFLLFITTHLFFSLSNCSTEKDWIVVSVLFIFSLITFLNSSDFPCQFRHLLFIYIFTDFGQTF